MLFVAFEVISRFSPLSLPSEANAKRDITTSRVKQRVRKDPRQNYSCMETEIPSLTPTPRQVLPSRQN
jgi:hypothetical protein